MNACRYMTSSECTNRIALPQYGARPSPGVCEQCEYRNGFRGAGDVLAWLLSWTPARRLQLEGCGGCKERQAAMNAAMPIGDKSSSGCGGCGAKADRGAEV